MKKKIVAIGGGENGRLLEDGSATLYETEKIDEEIVKLTKKKKPNYLFINHSMCFSEEIQESYFNVMKKIYGDKFGCECKHLCSNDLLDKNLVDELVEWADIIYEGGGDTKAMINLWMKTGFDKILYDAWNKGKVICGISAGAVCWFKECNSDSICDGENIFGTVECLNWFDLFVTPHCDENGRYISTKEQLQKNGQVGIMLSNRSAIEIIDDKFKIILNKLDNKPEPYVLKSYWNNGKYHEEKLVNEIEFLPIDKLYSTDD